MFCHKCPPKSICGSPMTNISIFLGPNYLPHVVINTAAYKYISLFCNTFLPSGKAVLVLICSGEMFGVLHNILTKCNKICMFTWKISGKICDMIFHLHLQPFGSASLAEKVHKSTTWVSPLLYRGTRYGFYYIMGR